MKTVYLTHYILYYPPSTQAHIVELDHTEDLSEQQLLDISKDNNVAVISYGIIYYYQGKRLGTLSKAREVLSGRT